jgi:hypothetical protein
MIDMPKPHDRVSNTMLLAIGLTFVALFVMAVAQEMHRSRQSLPADEHEILSLINDFPEAKYSFDRILRDRAIVKRDVAHIRRDLSVQRHELQHQAIAEQLREKQTNLVQRGVVTK